MKNRYIKSGDIITIFSEKLQRYGSYFIIEEDGGFYLINNINFNRWVDKPIPKGVTEVGLFGFLREYSKSDIFRVDLLRVEEYIKGEVIE